MQQQRNGGERGPGTAHDQRERVDKVRCEQPQRPPVRSDEGEHLKRSAAMCTELPRQKARRLSSKRSREEGAPPLPGGAARCRDPARKGDPGSRDGCEEECICRSYQRERVSRFGGIVEQREEIPTDYQRRGRRYNREEE